MDQILAGMYIALVVINIFIQHNKAGKEEIKVSEAIVSTIVGGLVVYLLVKGFFI